ncbi:MAG: PQQ-like beta-propeller repeat protein [Alphaproteobacteria bacterium]|nr:PQQ-like beta-propeller repeat protein [Alphaproteobacteria bacterium]
MFLKSGKTIFFLKVFIPAFILMSCDTFLGNPETPPLPGERISILKLNQELAEDPNLSDLKISLPEPIQNQDWAQDGGAANHNMQHVTLPENLEKIWSIRVGQSANSERKFLTSPIVAYNRVYTLDPSLILSSIDATTGKFFWRIDLTTAGEQDDLFGGGLAVADNKIFITTPFAKIFALDALTGDLLWETAVQGPIKSSPVVVKDKLFAITIDNQLIALSTETGDKLWTHSAVSDSPGLLGGSTPAAEENTVIVPYNSGEVFALRSENGRILWSENMTVVNSTEDQTLLSSIRAKPVIDKDQVIVMSNNGILASIDLRRGVRLWDANIAGTQTPWVAGNFIYVISSNNELICLLREDGRIRWIQSLPVYEDEEERSTPISWFGPILAGDRLIITGSDGTALSISPYTGEILSQQIISDHMSVAPIVAENKLFFLDDRGRITSFQQPQ